MINQRIAEIFNKMAELLEIKGDNPFKIRAYRRASQNIESLASDISDWSIGELQKIPGIGKDLANKIEEFRAKGKIQSLEELKQEIPEGLSLLTSVPGIGPKTARLVFDKFNVTNIADLEKIIKSHKLKSLPGIQEKTEQNILKGIELLKRGIERKPIGKVLPIANSIIGYLQKSAPVEKISIAGSIRRWRETIKDIDILTTSQEPQKVMQTFTKYPERKEVLLKGHTKTSILLKDNLQVDLRVVDPDSFGAALAYFTGSKAHNIRLREMAIKKGLKLNEYGIFRESDGKKIGGKTENEIFEFLDLPYIPPELREDTGEVEAAMSGNLPVLIEMDDIKGDLHVHSKFSDGRHGFEDLIEAAKKKGYAYIAVTDHSKGLAIAHGLNVERILEEKKQVDEINKRLKGFKILMGVEVDIKSDESLDFDDNILKRLDIVVASIHSGFKQSSSQLTSRMQAAMRNPYVNVIAHPTGRLIGEREAYEMNMDEILTTAKETGVALEINAYPLRLDLNDIYARKAKDMGIPLSINTDTHIVNQFDFMQYGVSIGRRGWLEKDNVINTLHYGRLVTFLKQKQIFSNSNKQDA